MKQPAPNAKFTVETVAKALHDANGIMAVAAKLLKCDRSTVKRYVDKYARLRTVRDEERAVLIDLAEGALVLAVKKGEWSAIHYTLTTLAKDRGYGEVTKTILANEDNAPLRIVVEYADDKPRKGAPPQTA